MKITKTWLSGFVDGVGCFKVSIIKNASITLGYQVQLEFSITQEERDIQVLQAIRKMLDCGLVRKYSSVTKGKEDKIWIYRVRDVKSLGEKIIPFFEKNELLTTKKHNFKNFKQVYLKILANEHLTEEGLEEITRIKARMNRGLIDSNEIAEVNEIALDKDIVPTLLKDKEYSEVAK